MFEKFISENGIEKIRNSLSYVVFDEPNNDFQTKIANYLYDENLKLSYIGESVIKELFGWVNNQEIPIFNNRTRVSMEYMGFGKWT